MKATVASVSAAGGFQRVTTAFLGMILSSSLLIAGARPGPLRLLDQSEDAFNLIMRENALFFNILVTFSFTASIADPAWGLSVGDININLISRSVRDTQGRQLLRARIGGVIRKNHNVELDILNPKGVLVGKGFFGYRSGQLTFYDKNGRAIIDGLMDSNGIYLLDDLRLPEGKRDLANGSVDSCVYCYPMAYAWYDGLNYQVGGGRMYPTLLSYGSNRLRMYWTFDKGQIGERQFAAGDAEYDLTNETTGAINSVLFDSDRTAESFFENPYSLVPRPKGKALLPRVTNDTGIAVTNPNSREISITYIARHSSGALVAGNGVINPVTYRFASGLQFAAYPAEIFRGVNDRGPVFGDTERGWVEVYSHDGDVQAMYLDGSEDGTALDGNIAAEWGSSMIVFSDLRPRLGESTEIVLLNLAYDDVMVRLELLDKEGRVLREEPEFFIAGYGMRNFYIGSSSDFMRPSDPSQSASLRVTCNNSNSLKSASCSEIVGLATYQDQFRSLATSYAVSAETAGLTLVTPYFISGGSDGGEWETTARVAKLDGTAAAVYLDLYDKNGTLLDTIQRDLVPGGQVAFSLSSTTLAWGDRLTTGYARLRSDSGKISGDLSVYWTNGVRSQTASYPLANYLAPSLRFNQIAQGTAGSIEYWTGLALMNDLNKSVTVKLDVCGADGSVDRSVEFTLKPYQQSVGLLSQFLNSEGYERVGGNIRVNASDPIIGIVLYGDARGEFMAAVPAVPR